MAASSDKQVFDDVAKPGSTPPDTSSKPVIVSHKPMLKDPMVNEESEDKGDPIIDEKPDDLKRATKANVIQPLHDEETKKKHNSAEAESDNEESEDKGDPIIDEELAKADKKQSKKEADKQTEKITKLIDSKKYYVKVRAPKRKRNKRAFIIGLMVVLLGLVGVGLAADAELIDLPVPFDFISKSQEVSEVPVQTKTEQTAPVKDSKTESSTKLVNYKLEVPESWIKVENKEIDKETKEISYKDTYTLPSGAKFIVHYDPGSKGGDCQPADTDIAHNAGNKCPTFEYLKAEKLAINEETQKLLPDSPGDIWLLNTKYTSPEGKTNYNLNIETVTNLNTETGKLVYTSPELNQPKMGPYWEDTRVRTLGNSFWITIEGVDSTSEEFFNNTDIKSIYTALQSFELQDR